MSANDPKETLAALRAAGFTVRQVNSSIYVMDPDDFEVQVQAPETTI